MLSQKLDSKCNSNKKKESRGKQMNPFACSIINTSRNDYPNSTQSHRLRYMLP